MATYNIVSNKPSNQGGMTQVGEALVGRLLFEIYMLGGLSKNARQLHKDGGVEWKKEIPMSIQERTQLLQTGQPLPKETGKVGLGDLIPIEAVDKKNGLSIPVPKGSRLIRIANLLQLYPEGLFPTPWVEALKQGGYWDATTPSFIRKALAYWGHIKAPKVEEFKQGGNWFSQQQVPKDFKGVKVWEPLELERHLWREGIDWEEFFRGVAITSTKEGSLILTKGALEVLFQEEVWFFPKYRKEGRFRYTRVLEGASAEAGMNWVRSQKEALGNILLWWWFHQISDGELSSLVNRDSTSILAPARLYGFPSPLNKASDTGTVGHLQVRLEARGPVVYNDESAYSPAYAAGYAFDEGLPVLFQHQLENIRVGLVAAGLGKSTFDLFIPYKGGAVKIKFSAGQFEVDKASKLFNRDSLELRVMPVLGVLWEAPSPDKSKNLVAGFKAKAKQLLA